MQHTPVRRTQSVIPFVQHRRAPSRPRLLWLEQSFIIIIKRRTVPRVQDGSYKRFADRTFIILKTKIKKKLRTEHTNSGRHVRRTRNAYGRNIFLSVREHRPSVCHRPYNIRLIYTYIIMNFAYFIMYNIRFIIIITIYVVYRYTRLHNIIIILLWTSRFLGRTKIRRVTSAYIMQ